MVKISPFSALRPAGDKVHLVVTRPVDSYSKEEIQEKLINNPFSFLQVLNPAGKTASLNLAKISEKFKKFRIQNILIREEAPCLYLYRQKKDSHIFTGIIGCASVQDYLEGRILKHEATITVREEKLTDYLDVCSFNVEPVSLFFPDDEFLWNLFEKITSGVPVYDFSTSDKIHHQLWKIGPSHEQESIIERFDLMDAVYIADGHHRSASSALLGERRKDKNKNHTGNEPYNFFMCIFFPESTLKVYEFNRLITDLGIYTKHTFIEELRKEFIVISYGLKPYRPAGQYHFGLYIDGEWFELILKPEYHSSENPEQGLDASVLSERILDPLIGIKDLRTDKRVIFSNGQEGIQKLMDAVDSGKAKAAFFLHPATMEQVKIFADQNLIMPPKSTYVEPKLRSALTIHLLD